MKLAFTYDDHHRAGREWDSRGQKEWLTDIFEAPALRIQRGCTREIRDHVEMELLNEGWALGVSINQKLGLKVTALKDDIAFQLQTGNMSRAPYDLIKLQYLFQSGKIEAAAIAVPTKIAAKKMGDNLVNAERIIREIELFDRVITAPILVVAFE